MDGWHGDNWKEIDEGFENLAPVPLSLQSIVYYVLFRKLCLS